MKNELFTIGPLTVYADMRIEAQGKAEFFDMGVPDILDYEKMKIGRASCRERV